MLKQRLHGLLLAAVLGLIVAVVMAAYGFPKIVSRQIQKNVQIDNSSAAYEKWQKLPFPLQFKVYLFNVTNPDEVTRGAKPKLAEIGPYCYNEYREKTVTGYGENDTISYKLKKRFTFNKELSGSLTEDDPVTVINLSYMAMLLKVQELMPGVIHMANEAMGLFFPNLVDPFLRVTVGELLFNGVFLNCSAENTILKIVCSRLKQEAPATMRASDQADGFYFSMFSHLNSSETGPYEVARGRDKITELGHILAYKGQRSMEMWNDPYCALINGSDSSIFPPIDTSDVPRRLYTFEPEVCRSLYAELEGERTIFNMSAYHYEVNRLSLASKSAVPNNKCFCKKNWSAKHDGCLMMGLLDLNPCQKVPVIASFPHFYLASEELLEYIEEGLRPEKEKHNTYVILEPTTGVVLKGVKRLQFNIELRNMPAAAQLENVSTGLFPMLWVEEGAEVNDEIVDLLRRTTVTLKYVEGVRWVVLALALVCFAWCGATVARKHNIWPRRTHSISFVMNQKNHAFSEEKTS